MKLSLEQIRSVTQGAAQVMEQAGGVSFSRFTQAENALYADTTFRIRCFTSAGIQLEFRTDATALTLKGVASGGFSRSFFSCDIFRDEELLGTLCNYDAACLPPDYTAAEFPLGAFAGTYPLGAGMKTLRIVLPYSVEMVIQSLELENATCLIPVRPKKTALLYGDSITQGYDALNPSRTFAVRLSRFLQAEAFNKGLGGECFNPALAAVKQDFSPDYITVAYGTNYVSHSNPNWDVDAFENACRDFYHNLRSNYPDSKIIGIPPIWRKDAQEEMVRSVLEHVTGVIKAVCREVDAVFLQGWELVPHKEIFFGDACIHPNNEGFDCFFENLIKHL